MMRLTSSSLRSALVDLRVYNSLRLWGLGTRRPARLTLERAGPLLRLLFGGRNLLVQ